MLQIYVHPVILGPFRRERKKEGNTSMRSTSPLFYVAIAAAVVALLIGVYYLIPGIPHLLTTTAMHIKHAVLFFAIAVICVIGALVMRPKTA